MTRPFIHLDLHDARQFRVGDIGTLRGTHGPDRWFLIVRIRGNRATLVPLWRPCRLWRRLRRRLRGGG